MYFFHLKLAEKKRYATFASAGFTRANKRQKTEECDADYEDKLNQLIFRFVNHGGHCDRTVSNKRFRDMIDYCVHNSFKLHAFKHMGRRKYTDVRSTEFLTFVNKTKETLDEIRQWYINESVCSSLFIISF